MRLGEKRRRPVQGTVPQPARTSYRQHLLVRQAGTGRLPLRLCRNRPDRLQRPERLPPHELQRRTDDPLRRREILRSEHHQLSVPRRPDEPRPGFPAALLFYTDTGPPGARRDRRPRVPLPRRQSLPLAPRCFRLLPPYQHARTGALQGGRHPQPDPRSFRAAGDSRRMGRRYVPARQPLPHARLRSGPLPRIHLRRRPMALHGRPAR